jgi:glutamyl-tRNA synthetase
LEQFEDVDVTLDDFERRYPQRELPGGAHVGRIAPSPTGKPHIGTALQAVINRALADKTNGVFILRIEDTDQARLVPGVVDEILTALRWLGLEPDEGPGRAGTYGPYIQSERLDMYQAAAHRLIESGHAYRCFCSAERLEQLRTDQQALKLPMRYDGACRELTASDVAARISRGESSVVRMRIPANETIAFEDLARGRIAIESAQVDDAVILKSDGFPTYHLAVVVDDHFMRVTMVVRGEEWISSTPKHVLLYRHLGWTMPPLVHTALLRDAKGRKLSKRSGDTSIDYYRVQGILPEAFRNFLTRIIWFHPQQKDVYDFSDFSSQFELHQLSVAGPVVDPALLSHINGEHIRRLGAEELYRRVMDHMALLIERGEGFTDSFEGGTGVAIGQQDLETFVSVFSADRAKALRVLSLEPERFKRLTDVLVQARLYYPEFLQSPTLDVLVGQMGSKEAVRDFLEDMSARHDELVTSQKTKEAWDAHVRGYAARLQLKPGKPFMTLRLAITGTQMSPPLYEILHVLGPDEVRRRFRLVLDGIA